MKPAIPAIAVVLLASAAPAATTRAYFPGGSPCAGVCTLEWARQAFDVPSGDPHHMVIPAGTFIQHMSEGVAGEPVALRGFNRVLGLDEPGIGYPLPGTNMWMVRIDACLNWAVVLLPDDMASLPDAMWPPSQTAALPPGPQATVLPSGPMPGYLPLWPVPPPRNGTVTINQPEASVLPKPPVTPEPPSPLPVPLPAGATLLLLALAGLAGLWRAARLTK
ncbi:MAG: hypothetical protein ACK5MY_10515 [Jhaorihella sp.]